MYEKLVTFEEEKRKEHLYLLFNSFFICACLMCVFDTVFKAPLLITSAISNESVRWVVETVLRPLCASFGAFLPFLVYNIRQETPFKQKLKPAANKASGIYYVLGFISVFAAVPFFFYLGELFSAFMRADGYVIHEIYPNVGNGPAEYVFYTVVTSVISAFFLELSFRGVAAEKLSYAHTFDAFIVPALLSSLYTYSFIRIPYLFGTSLIITWCYLKTRSLYLSMTLNAAATVSFTALCILRQEQGAFYEENMMFIALACLVICLVAFAGLASAKGIKVKYPEPKNAEESYERLTNKEAVLGILKAFAFWIMIFMLVFQLFFTYLDKPMVAEPTGDTVVTEQSSSSSGQ